MLLRYLGIVFSVATIVWIGTKIDLSLLIKSFAELNLPWVLLMIVVYLGGFLIRGLRSKYMLTPFKKVDFKTAVEGVIVGYAANNILPARAGEFIRAIFLGKKESISKTSILGTVMIERVFDGIVLVALLIICTFLLNPDRIRYGAVNMIILTGCLIFGMSAASIIAGAYHRLWLELQLSRLAKYLPDKISVRLLVFIKKIMDSFNFVKSYKTLSVVMLLSTVIWVIEGLVFWTGLIAFHFPAQFIIAYFTLALVNLWMVLPSAPGGIGLFQGAAIYAFSLFGLSPEKALSYSLVVHAVMIVPITIIGLFIINWYSLSIHKIKLDSLS